MSDSAEVNYNLGNQSFREGDYDRAIELHKTAISADPLVAHYHIALSHAMKRNGERTGGCCKRAFLLDPTNQNGLIN